MRSREVYRGRRSWRWVLTIGLFLIALLLVTAVVLFYALQKYIVYGQDGLSLELPFLKERTEAPEASADTGEGVVAELEIRKPDFSNVTPAVGENLAELRALFVPAKDISADGLRNAAEAMQTHNANALVLEMKPESGQLAWTSQLRTAASFGVNGTAELSEPISELKERGVYLVAALSCCVDELMATRNLPLALKDSEGYVYRDEAGYWLDPYNKDGRNYITELGRELAGMGFDELLLVNVAHPEADVVYSKQMSVEKDRVSAVSGLALALADALKDTNIPVSALMDTEAYRAGETPANGQDLSFFLKVFDRVFVATDASALESDRALAAAAMGGEGDTALRFVPILPSAADAGSWLLQAGSQG